MEQNQEPNQFRESMWILAGFKPDLIRNCKIDEHHATVIGWLLLLVGIYAVLAWTFFFQTVTDSIIAAAIGGLFMGAFIVSFDRALIASLAAGKTNFLSLGFRLMLAFLLGVFLSQPMILKFYQPEVEREAQIIMDQKVQERKVELQAIYASETENMVEQRDGLIQALDDKEVLVTAAETDFKEEMDGSGGTGQWGYHNVSKQKERIYLRHKDEYAKLLAANEPEIQRIQQELDEQEDKITTEIDAYRSEHTKMGTLILAEALESLISKDESNTLRNRILLLTVILTLIELSALIAKMLFPMASYRETAALVEQNETGQTSAERAVALQKIKAYKQHALDTELALIEDFFEKSRSVNDGKVDQLMEEWKVSEGGHFQTYWQRFKKQFLIGS